jgi:hypothetical protein
MVRAHDGVGLLQDSGNGVVIVIIDGIKRM